MNAIDHFVSFFFITERPKFGILEIIVNGREFLVSRKHGVQDSERVGY